MNTLRNIGYLAPSHLASRVIRLGIGLLLGAVLTASAQTSLDWNNSGTAFASGTSWVNGVAPADSLTTNIANFGTASPTFQPSLGTSQSLAGISFVSAAGNFTLSGAGTLTLGASGINNASTAAASSETVQVPIVLGVATTFSNSGLTGNITIQSNVNTAGNGLTLANGQTGTGFAIVSGVISGSGGVTMAGGASTQAWRITGNNTYTGGTTINNGTLFINGSNSTPLPANGNVVINDTNAGSVATLYFNNITPQSIGTLTFGGANATSTSTNNLTLVTGASLTLGGTVTYDATNLPSNSNITGGTLALGANRIFNVGHSGTTSSDLNISSNLTGSGLSLTKTGNGRLQLTGTNTYDGGTIVNGGTLFVGGNNSLATNSAVTINDQLGGIAVIGVNAGSGGNNNIGTLTLGGTGATATSVNNVSINSSTLTLGGTVTYNATGNPLGSTISSITTGTAGTLALGGNRIFNIADSTNASTSTELTISAPITGSGQSLTKTGAGRLLVSGANTYDGGTIINGGQFFLNANNTLASTGNITINDTSGAIVGTTTPPTATSTFLLGTNLSQTIGALTFGGAGASTGSINNVSLNSGSTLTLGGTVTFDATNNPTNSSITGGTLDLGGGTRTFNIGNTSTSGSDLIVSSVISDGAITKTGAGVLKIQGTNTYAGTTTINDGQIFVSPTATPNALGTIIINELNAGGTATFNLDANKTQTIGAVTLGGATATSTAGLVIGTNSTLTLGGTVTYDGTNGPLVSSISGNGTLALGGDRTFNVGTSATVGNSTDLNIFTSITGSSNLTKTGAGQLSLGVVNTYTGATIVNDGALRIGVTNALPGTANIYVNETNGGSNAEWYLGTPATGAISQTIGSLTFGGAGATSSATNTVFIANGASGGDTLTMGGAITYDATNNPHGATISGQSLGTLVLGASQLIAVGHSTNATTDLTISATIGGTNGFTKTGSGALALSGVNTYTGATTAGAGTLFVNNTSGSGVGTGALEIQNGALLRGFGFIGGATTIDSGASISPGSAGSPATLTFSNGLTLNDGGVFNFQLGTISDKIALTGANTLTGASTLGSLTINLSNSGGFAAGTYPLFDFSSGSTTVNNFVAGDFTLGTTVAGYTYNLTISGNVLDLTATASAIPEPSTYAAIFGLVALAGALWHRRRQSLSKTV